jgi:hypothetical protein
MWRQLPPNHSRRTPSGGEAGIANFKNKKIAALKFKGGYQNQGENEETPQRGIFLSTDGDCVICQG